MKAIIVEIRNNQASLLTDNGCIKTVKNKNYKIGQVIFMSNIKKFSIKKISAIAASAAAFILLGAGTFAYASPYTYVSVDVNPSIEYTVNCFDRVINVTAVNDDGEDILNQISIDMENQSISDAIENTVEQISKAGYFDGEEQGGIVITTSCEDLDKADTLAEELKQSVEQQTADDGVDDVEIETYSVGLERVKEAKALGVTPGKLNLVEKLQSAAGNSTVYDTKEWLSKPVKDIMKETKVYTKATMNSGEDADIVNEEENESDIDNNDDIASKDSSEQESKAKKSHKKVHGYDLKSEEDDNDFDDNEGSNDSKIQDYEEDDDKDTVSEQVKKDREKAKKAAEKAREQAKKEAEQAKGHVKKEAEQAKERAEKEAERAKKQLEEEDDSEYEQDSESDSSYENSEDDKDKQNNQENEDDNDQGYDED